MVLTRMRCAAFWISLIAPSGCGLLSEVVSTVRPVAAIPEAALPAAVPVGAAAARVGLASLRLVGERLAPRVSVGGRVVQGLDLAQLASVKVSIVGHGQPVLPDVTAPVVDGVFAVSLVGLTPGPRRIVQAVGLDHEGREVPGAASCWHRMCLYRSLCCWRSPCRSVRAKER